MFKVQKEKESWIILGNTNNVVWLDYRMKPFRWKIICITTMKYFVNHAKVIGLYPKGNREYLIDFKKGTCMMT